MTTSPTGPRDEGTPADQAEGTMRKDQYLGRDSIADLGGDEGLDAGAGADDPTTETDEDSRFA